MDFNEPHLPCFPCREIYDAGGYETLSVAPWGSFGDTFRNKPYMQRRQLKNWNAEDMNWSDWEKILRLEFALMEQTDRAIGEVLDLLKEKGMMENTVVIFTADHGDLCGSHRMVDKHYVLYDDIIRIPLIVMDGQGKKIEKGIVENIDFAPSVLNWAGISVPEEMQGRPLTQQGKEFAVSTFNGQQFGLYTLRAITDGQDKYIFNASDVCEYYDLRTDPDEMENRIDDEECRKRILFLKRKLYDILLDRGDKMVMNPWMKNRFLNDEV